MQQQSNLEIANEILSKHKSPMSRLLPIITKEIRVKNIDITSHALPLLYSHSVVRFPQPSPSASRAFQPSGA